MKNKLLLGVGIGALFLSGSAFAADMPFKVRPITAPYFSWTGFYVGANAGYGWVDGNGTITISGASGPVSGSGHGFLAGAQAGYNWQVSSFVLGVEGDFQGSFAKGTVNGSAGANTFTADAKVPWFATVRGRLGYAWDRTLLYMTGGGVFGDNKIDGTSSTTGAFSASKTFETWTVGGGVEYAFLERWSAKIEYLYMGLPNHVPGPPGTTAVTGSMTNQLVRAGLNYRF